MSHFGRSINEFKVDAFQSGTLGVNQKGFTQSDDTFLGSNTTSLQHDEVVVDFSVMWETTHGGDRLVGQIVFSGSVVLDDLEMRN